MFLQVEKADFFNVWKTETQGKDLQWVLMVLLNRDIEITSSTLLISWIDHIWVIAWFTRGTTNKFPMLLILFFYVAWKIFFDKVFLSFLLPFADLCSWQYMRQEKEFGEPENLEIGKCYCYYCFSSKILSVFKISSTERLFGLESAE